MATREPASIPPSVRWVLIVLLPALGFTLASTLMFSLLTRASGTALVVITFLAGAAGAAGALAAGLVLAPWLPATEVGGGTAIDDGVPPAPHPAGLSWVGPAAAVLVGLGAGVPLGAGLIGRVNRGYYYSQDLASVEPFTRPALAVLLLSILAIGCLVAHQRHGDEAAPAVQAPFHRVVLRCALRGGMAGAAVALVGLLPLWLHDEVRRVGEALMIGALGGASVAALITAAETIAWRAPPRWRWPTAVAVGALSPPVILLTIAFLAELLRSGSALGAADEVLEALGRDGLRRPGKSLGVIVSVALPFAVLVGARAGFLPYFGRRAPWPLVAQVPLGWLAAALLLALMQLLVDAIDTRELTLFVTYLGLTLPALVVMLRLSEPVEQRLAARWVVLTGGGND